MHWEAKKSSISLNNYRNKTKAIIFTLSMNKLNWQQSRWCVDSVSTRSSYYFALEASALNIHELQNCTINRMHRLVSERLPLIRARFPFSLCQFAKNVQKRLKGAFTFIVTITLQWKRLFQNCTEGTGGEHKDLLNNTPPTK